MPVSKKLIKTKTCARPNVNHQLTLASNASVELIKFFEQYYNIVYPFPKLDHFGTPDFAYGAMEVNIFLNNFK